MNRTVGLDRHSGPGIEIIVLVNKVVADRPRWQNQCIKCIAGPSILQKFESTKLVNRFLGDVSHNYGH